MNTKKQRISKQNIPETDSGIQVSELLKLLTPSNKITDDLVKELNIEEIKEDFIPIQGAKTLFNSQISIRKKFDKVDLLSKLDDITFYAGEDFCFNFKNITDSINFPTINELSAFPIYSAQRDFFGSLFNMDKYAKTLIDNNHKEIVNRNLDLLKKVKNFEKRYRLLFNKEDKKYYLRGIVSKDNYFDYNNSIAVVIALLTLYHEIKKSGVEYSLMTCEYNDSNIRMIFNTSEIRKLDGIGYVRNIIEVSNDEIKREALKFYGICSINYETDKSEGEIYIKPKDVESKILSIKHNQKPESAINTLAEVENTAKIHNELYRDIESIKNIKNPEQIKFIIKRKISNVKNDDIKSFQSKILAEINKSDTNNILDLLILFNKIQLISEEDIEASEYLRFMFYEALIRRK